MPLAVANRYARALVDLAVDPSKGFGPETAARDLATIQDAIESSPELKNVLLSPAVQASRKRTVLGKLAEPLGLSKLTQNFLSVLVDHRRIDILGEIREAFERQLDERLGLVRAEVTSAVELSERQRESVRAGLAELTGRQVRPAFSVDPSVLGGVMARIGSTVYDGTVRGQLEQLRRKLVQ